MEINKDLVRHVATLANLQLSEAEVTHYETQLGRILGHIEQLSKLEDKFASDWRTDNTGDPTPERSDLAKASLTPEQALSNAPQKIGSAFQVPRILE